MARASAIDEVLLKVARERFFADGFDAVAMEQVAAEARVSKGTLYARHPSKEALFTAVIDDLVNEWSRQAAKQDHLLTDDIAQRLRHHAHTIADSLMQPDVRALQRLIMAMRTKTPRLFDALRDQGYRYIVDLVARDMEEAAVRDQRAVKDAGAVARMLVAGLSGFELQEEGFADGGSDLHAFADRLVDVLLSGRDAW